MAQPFGLDGRDAIGLAYLTVQFGSVRASTVTRCSAAASIGWRTSPATGSVLFWVRPDGISATAEADAPPHGRRPARTLVAVNSSR